MAKKKVDIQLTEAQTTEEAVNYIFIGFKFFLLNHTKKTLLVIFGVLLGLSMFFKDYITTDRIKIMDEVKPIASQPTSLLSNPFMLYAQEKGDKFIEFDGKAYATWDQEWEIKKIKGVDAVLIFNKQTKGVRKVELPFDKLK